MLLIRLALALHRPQAQCSGCPRGSAEGRRDTSPGGAARTVASHWRAVPFGDAEDQRHQLRRRTAEAARVLIVSGDPAASDLQVDAGMAAARKAVAASGSLEEAQRQVVRMLGPVPAHVHLALAERALAERDDELASDAANRAIETGTGGAVAASG